MLIRKEQVNLCLVERSNVVLTISYILLICERLQQVELNIKDIQVTAQDTGSTRHNRVVTVFYP